MISHWYLGKVRFTVLVGILRGTRARWWYMGTTWGYWLNADSWAHPEVQGPGN